MNVTLPSGRTVRDVPEGTTQRDLLDKLARAGGFEDDVREMQAATIVRPIGREGFKQAAEDVARETNAPGRFLQGVGETFDRYALGAKGLATDLTPEDKERLAQNKMLAEAGGTAATLGQAAGDIAITAPAMAAGGAAVPAVGRAVPMLPKALGTLPGRVAGAVGPSAALGALSDPEDRTRGAAFGAAGGALGAGVNRALGGVVKPLLSREGRELIEQGIQPTPGQAMGGIANKLEEKVLGPMPVVGDIVARSRNRAINEFNEALAGRVSQTVTGEGGLPRAAGRKLGHVGDEAMLKLREQIGQVYEDVLGRVPKLRIEPEQIDRKVVEILNDPALDLSEASAKRLRDYAEKYLLSPRAGQRNAAMFSPGGEITGETAKRIESDMGKAAIRAKSSAVGDERAYGEALDQLHQFWREGLMGSLNPADQAMLQRANQAWRAFRPMDDAASKATSQLRGGVYTPRVLRTALATADKSQSDNALRGLREQPVAAARTPYEYAASMSRAGQALGDVVPDSGTAPRLLAATILGGGALVNPALTAAGALGGGAAAAALYSRAVSKLITQGALPATREAVAAYLERQGVPRDVIPMVVEQLGQTTLRTKGH